ncbi:MAG: hypothetical protein QXK39_02240, partial [Nitrososphaerota archaeon]
MIMKRYGVRLRESHISVWVRGLHSPYNGTRIPSINLLKPSKELAYIVGVVAGDGYVRRSQSLRRYYSYYVGLEARDREFV